jgi:hypothetical protein
VKQTYAAYPNQRERITAMLLFGFGNYTGRRVRQAFGDDLCDRIVWENASPEIGGRSDSVFPPDPQHIRAVLHKHNPDLVITFGKVAFDGLNEAMSLPGDGILFAYIHTVHPAARGADIPQRLAEAAARVRGMAENARGRSDGWSRN